MSSIIVSTSDYQDVLMCYLLDLLVHGNSTNNEIFDKCLNKMRGLGLRAPLLNCVLEMEAHNRVKYSIIKSALMNSSGRAVITVSGDMEKAEKD